MGSCFSSSRATIENQISLKNHRSNLRSNPIHHEEESQLPPPPPDEESMAAVNWSELPKELLNLISRCFYNEIDLIRFRSVCSNWRSSSIPNHHLNILPLKFPLLNYVPLCYFSIINNNDNDNEIIDSINNTNSPFCYLSKRTIFLVKPPQHGKTVFRRRPWLIRVTQNSPGKTKLFHPLISYPGRQQTLVRPHVLDFNKLSVLQLGTDFIIDEDEVTFQNQRGSYLHPQTVLAVTCHGKNPLILGTLCHYSSCPVLFRDHYERWTRISNISTFNGDICLFKGRFYIVHQSGQTFTVGPDSSVELAGQPLGRGTKILVESEGELLLLDIYQSSFLFSIVFFKLDEKEKKWVQLMDFDEKEKKWVRMRNFGDRVFFLGRGCSFSASASDLCIPNGNCVIFIDESVLSIHNMKHGNRVFHLKQDRLSCLSKYPEYLNLFLPPEWILTSEFVTVYVSSIEKFLMS